MLDRLKRIKSVIKTNVFSDYQKSLERSVKSMPIRRKVRDARDYKQTIISDYRNTIRNHQRNHLDDLKYKLYNQLTVVTKDKNLALSVINTKDKFGYSMNYAIQRANTRLITKVGYIYSDNYKDKRLNKEVFYQQANEAVVEHKFMQDLLDYTVSRALNEMLLDNIKFYNTNKVTIKLSDTHKITCVCNDYAGKTYSINDVVLPPYHPHCNCYVYPATDNKAQYHTSTYNKLLEQIEKDLTD